MSSPSLPNPFADDRLAGAALFNPALDVASVHEPASTLLRRLVERARGLDKPDGQAKVVILRSIPGFGKTHVVGRVGHLCAGQSLFVFVPQVEEYGSPVKHLHWHVLDTLFAAPAGRTPILHGLLARLCHDSFRRFFDFLPHTVKQQQQTLRERLDEHPECVLEIVKEVKEVAPYLALADSMANRLPTLPTDIVRALALGWSPRATEAWSWLRGDSLDETVLAELRLPVEPPTTTRLLQTIAALLKRLDMALVVCCDQSEQLLHRPGALKELTTALMGWLDTIPNIVLVLTFLRDEWLKLEADTFQAFLDRSRALDLETLKGAQAVELIRQRLAGWPGARPDRGPLWPFRDKDIQQFVERKPVSARALLKRCSAVLEVWLAKRSDKELGIEGEEEKPPLEELFRQEWGRSLELVRKDQLNPDNLQDERLFRAAREAIDLVRAAGTPVGGLEVLQIQPGALGNKYLGVQLKLGAKSSAAAFPVVVCASNLSGGLAMTGFLKALGEAVADPVAGAVLVRPSAQLTLGPKTEARKKYETLKSSGKLRPFELTDNRAAFEQLECYLRLLDRAKQQDLQLGQETIAEDQCRQLAIKTQVLAGLPLVDRIFCGWPQAAAVAVPAAVQTQAVAATVSHGPRAKSQVATQAEPKPPSKPPAADLTPPPAGSSWADKLLRAVADKLIEFGQKVEPLGVEIGPTFARLRLKPLGRTSIGRVRNHASDLRAHIAGIATVPVIADQPGYISVDVQRPDRQTVELAECLRRAPADLAGLPAFPVGVDVTGKPHWLNLADSATCHILAAGTTGSGKSEFLKALLAGLTARLSPLELRFVLIDPKHVTFNFPGTSPYLLHPVAHTVDEAMPLVQQCFDETERRYKLLEARGLEHVGQLRGKDALPRIVVVFDEFADLMAERENRRELETSLKRIGALARAAGIHLVLATQRPDKDVVTSQLKANLPTRICLRVDGERNSKIILSEEGGENLLGHGDLFWKHGSGMVRLQGAFVAKAELEQLLRLE